MFLMKKLLLIATGFIINASLNVGAINYNLLKRCDWTHYIKGSKMVVRPKYVPFNEECPKGYAESKV